MNILLATDVFPPQSGGSGWSTFHLARALVARGHCVEIVQPRFGRHGVQTRVYEGLTVREVGCAAGNLPGLRARQRTRALENTVGAYLAARAHEFDLIHAQHMLTVGAAVAAKAQTSLPVVSTVRDYWPVCLYGTLWRDKQVCPVCRGGEITRCLAQRYGPAARFMLPAVPLVQRELERRQRALQASDAIIAVSRFVAETLQNRVPESRLAIVPNLIDLDATQAAARPSSAGNPSPSAKRDYLLFIGKLNELKGADLLPEILRRSGLDLPLVVAGEGELRSRLVGTPGIQVRGWLANAETLALLGGARALLFPSRWAEPLARTLLEAQALGVPTVAWNSGGTRDIIEDNLNGLLAAHLDEFAGQLRRLVQDEALAQTLSANARRVAQTKFAPPVVAAHLEATYQAVVRPPG